MSDAMNYAHEHDGKDWHAKLLHVSGFTNYMDPSVQDWIGPADIICFQRNLISDEILSAVRYWKGMGKVFAADLDDAYTILPWSNPAHAFWVQNSGKRDPAPLKMLETGLSLCDALTSPNRLILGDWKHVVKGYQVPNFARTAWWTGLPEREALKTERGQKDRIVIGWGGSVSHYDSWWGSGLREAATAVTKKHPEVLWMICGNDPRIIEQLLVPLDNKMMQPGVAPNDWPKIVKGFDIGVAPLFGPYDQRRSWIKGLEYLLGGVPWIGTTGEPYSDMASLGTLVQNGEDNWTRALNAIIEHLIERQAQAARRIETGRQWLIDNQLDFYARTYGAIIEESRMRMSGGLPGLYYVVKTPPVEQKEQVPA